MLRYIFSSRLVPAAASLLIAAAAIVTPATAAERTGTNAGNTVVFELPAGEFGAVGAPGGKEGEKAVEIDGFQSPASFFVSEKDGAAAFLDARRGLFMVFSMDGKLRHAAKLPFEKRTIDMAYFPEAKKLFVVFKNSAQIGAVDIDAFAKAPAFGRAETFDVAEAIGGKAPVLQRIWACSKGGGGECLFVVNAAAGKNANAAFGYKNGKLSTAARLEGTEGHAAGSAAGAAAFTVESAGTAETVLVTRPLDGGKTLRFPLAQELAAKREGYGCRGCQALGADDAGNAFVRVDMAGGDDSPVRSFVYRFKGGKRFAGRVEIPSAPGFFTNRAAFVDGGGKIFCVTRETGKTSVALRSFEINEMN